MKLRLFPTESFFRNLGLYAVLLFTPLCAAETSPGSSATTDNGAAAATHENASSPAPAPPNASIAPTLRLPDSYLKLYEEILAANQKKPSQNYEMEAAFSNVALRLWEQTHDESYRQEALKEFNLALSDPKFSLADFHILHHFGELICLMKKENLLSADQHQKLVDLAEAELTAYLKTADDSKMGSGALYNIRIAQIAGYAGLLKFLDGELFDQQQAVLTRLNDYFDLLCHFGNTDEDATNYDSLGMAFAIDLARLLGREKDFNTPDFRRDFANFRDIVSPSGLLPEYGDSYFSYDDMPMDRIYLMEYAAHFYNDSSFLDARNKMWVRPQSALPSEDHWVRSLALIGMPFSTTTPQPIPGSPTQILYRNTSDATQPVIDKLILRSGRKPGASMIMMDLYASGSHAAKDKSASISYYETAQVPLFHNMGRRGTRSAIDGNILWARPPAENFPGLWNHPGEWFTMTFPFDLLTKNKTGEVALSRMNLRNFPGHPNNKACTELFFDNLRLEGPSGTLLVDSFDTADGWVHLAPDTTPVTSPDKTQGAASQEIAWNQVKTEGVDRVLPKLVPEPFTKQQYTTLKMDLKYEGTHPYILVRGFGEELEIGAQVLRPSLKSATVESRAGDSTGQVTFERYITDDTMLTRRIVLTAEGYLVIRDLLTPGPSMDGWNAGQLWQLYTMAAHGDHWFCSEDDGTYPNVSTNPTVDPTRQMLVRFAASGTTVNFEQSFQSYTYPNPRGLPARSFVTTYSERKVTAGHPEVFSMVVVPNDPRSMSPEDLAKNVAVSQSPDGATEATISLGAKPVVIRVNDQTWSVKRNP